MPQLFHSTWGEQSEEIDTKTILWKDKMVILLSVILGLSVLLSHRISCIPLSDLMMDAYWVSCPACLSEGGGRHEGECHLAPWPQKTPDPRQTSQILVPRKIIERRRA